MKNKLSQLSSFRNKNQPPALATDSDAHCIGYARPRRWRSHGWWRGHSLVILLLALGIGLLFGLG